MSHLAYTAHLSRDGNPLLTVCGEPWQGWQAPAGYTDVPGHVELPPRDEPRPHRDVVRGCCACLRAGCLEANLARAVDLLREFGACDQYTGQPYDEVHEFLRSLGVDPRA